MDTYSALYKQGRTRLNMLRHLQIRTPDSLENKMKQHGIARHDFIKWSTSVTAMLALPQKFSYLVTEAAELANRVPLIWLHMAECTGCSESFIHNDTPNLNSLIFDHISLEYHETLMATSGCQAEENLEHALEEYKGNYLLAVEGAIPTINNGAYLTVGNKGYTGLEIIKHAAENAAAIISVGTCSSFSGIQATIQNPIGAKCVYEVVDKPVINLGGCPPSETNIVGTLMYFIMFGKSPALDMFNRPQWAYGPKLHNIGYHPKFDTDKLAEEFDDLRLST